MNVTAATPPAAEGAGPDRSDAEGPAALHREWILAGWERHEGDPPFRFADKLGRFYSARRDLHLYDSFDSQHRVARTAADYGSFWEGPFNRLRSARHAVTAGPETLVEGDLASTVLEFVARLEGEDRQVTGVRAWSSLVWRREGGEWRIIREQNAVREVPRGEVEAALARQD